jgi:HSP20 family protein
MSNVAVEKVSENGNDFRSLIEETTALAERIRDRAFQIFQSRGRADGFSLDDWFKAERDLMLVPEADLVEKDGAHHLSVSVPGFDEKDLRITALPEALIIRADSRHEHSKHEHSKEDGNLHFCDFSEKSLFRRFDLPARIDSDKVTARLDKGVLRIDAPTAVKAASKPVAVSAAAA